MTTERTTAAAWQARLLRWVTGVLLAAAVAGCAAPQIKADKELTGNEGAVVLKLLSDVGGNFDPIQTLSYINLRTETPDVEKPLNTVLRLTRSREVTNTTGVFSGLLAPGRYRILNAGGAAGNITYTYPLRALSGTTFEVKTGQVTLLGSALLTPLGGMRFVLGHVPPDEDLVQTFEQLYPAVGQQVRGRPFNTFELTPELNEAAGLAPSFKKATVPESNLHQTTDGGLYVGGRLGMVLWRKPGTRELRRLDTGGWREVLSLRPYKGGLLAAGEEGLLRFSSDEGRTWQALTPPDLGMILLAEPLGNGKVLALSRRDSTWTVHVSDDALKGAWKPLGSFPDERSFNNPVALTGGASVATQGNRVALMMPNGSMQLIDGDSGAIANRSIGQTLAGHFRSTPDGLWVAMAATLVRTVLVSTDDGANWTDMKTTRFMGALVFKDRSTAYAVSPIDPGMFAGAYGLLTSRDGGKTWARTGDVPGGGPQEAVRRLDVDRSDGALLSFMRNGAVLRSTDEGKTWERYR